MESPGIYCVLHTCGADLHICLHVQEGQITLSANVTIFKMIERIARNSFLFHVSLVL